MKTGLSFLIPIVLMACHPVSEHGVQPLPEVHFPIGGFSPSPERDRQAGFTLAGPSYNNAQQRLAECEAVGLPCIYKIGEKIDFLGKKGLAVKTLDFENIRRDIRTQVEAVMASDAIAVWYLSPEELRSWKPLEMEYLRIASEVIRETDPKKRPVWMYEPNHRTASTLKKTFPSQQVVGKGLYVNYSNRREESVWVRWSMGQVMEAVRESAPQAIPYAVLEMFQEPKEDLSQAGVWARYDSYASLISGAKGIVIFSFANRKKFSKEAWTAYYDAYARVARELNSEMHLGAIFLLGKEEKLPDFKQISGPVTASVKARNTGPEKEVELPAIGAKAYSLNGRHFLFLVNSSLEEVSLQADAVEKWSPLFADQQQHNDIAILPPLGVSAFEIPSL